MGLSSLELPFQCSLLGSILTRVRICQRTEGAFQSCRLPPARGSLQTCLEADGFLLHVLLHREHFVLLSWGSSVLGEAVLFYEVSADMHKWAWGTNVHLYFAVQVCPQGRLPYFMCLKKHHYQEQSISEGVQCIWGLLEPTNSVMFFGHFSKEKGICSCTTGKHWLFYYSSSEKLSSTSLVTLSYV